MLVVYYCGHKECKRVHIRTDERTEDTLSVCPRCDNNMIFLCDFETWTTLSETNRQKMIKNTSKISYNIANMHFMNDNDMIENDDSEVLVESISLSKQNEILENEYNKLKDAMTKSCEEGKIWFKRMKKYHDALWHMLELHEPSKFNKKMHL